MEKENTNWNREKQFLNSKNIDTQILYNIIDDIKSKKITIKDNRKLSYWPEDFFDQSISINSWKIFINSFIDIIFENILQYPAKKQVDFLDLLFRNLKFTEVAKNDWHIKFGAGRIYYKLINMNLIIGTIFSITDHY